MTGDGEKVYTFFMKWKRELGKIKTCPRCHMQYAEGLEVCSDCGLIFARLEIATNTDAKKKIKRFDFDYIIKTNQLPSDVSYIKLLLYSIFLGVFGGHCFYVGRYFRGSLLLANFLFLLCLTIFNDAIAQVGDGALLGILSTLCGFILLVWLWDIIMIATKRFKVPIAIDLESERAIYEKENEERQKYLNEVDKLNDEIEANRSILKENFEDNTDQTKSEEPKDSDNNDLNRSDKNNSKR